MLHIGWAEFNIQEQFCSVRIDKQKPFSYQLFSYLPITHAWYNVENKIFYLGLENFIYYFYDIESLNMLTRFN
jgi:hypothetical protein